MGIRATISAIRELHDADKKLANATATATSDTDPGWPEANQRVTTALDNPALPRRYLDPADQ